MPNSKIRAYRKNVGAWSLGFGSFFRLWPLCFELLAFCILLFATIPASAASRVKDIAMVAGARDNQLVGYGIITGIAGDGDKNPVYTLQSIANFLQRFGINVPPATLSS